MNVRISVTLPSTGEVNHLIVSYGPGNFDTIPHNAEISIVSGVDVDAWTDEDWDVVAQASAKAYDAEECHCWENYPDELAENWDLGTDFYDLD